MPRRTRKQIEAARKRSDSAHAYRLRTVYGITPEEYRVIYDYQGGCCYICQRATGKTRRLAVDHDHKTGLIRGLLCKACNRMLGHARDDGAVFWRAAEYLAMPPAQDIIGDRKVPDDRAVFNGPSLDQAS